MADGAEEERRPLSIARAATDVHHNSSHLTSVFLTPPLRELVTVVTSCSHLTGSGLMSAK